MIRVAFTMIDGAKWKGGYNYLLNLFHILRLYQKDRITPVLFVGEKCTPAEVLPFQEINGVEIVRTPLLDENRRVRSLVQAILIGRDVPLRKLFDAYGINLVFETARFFGWRLGLPAIAWITDFQHLALPDMFSGLARWKRDIGFRAQVLGRRVIMLSSDHARRICEATYPKTRGYTRTVNFAVPPGDPVTRVEARMIADSYKLPKHFFYMPNQFWRHKNHALVVEALAILRQRGVHVTVAASGKQDDYRDSDYFFTLQTRVKQLGLETDFRFLGLVPYPHVKALMHASVALLNPSLSEGWSTPVEEAKALGISMVLSDLDVHKEQMGGKATYFDRYSSQSLATALEGFQPLSQEQQEQAAGQAKSDAKQRVRLFGEQFASLAERCVQGRVG